MNNETKYSIKRLLILYYSFRYSEYYPLFIPILSLIGSIGIIWFFLVPQVQSWFSVQEEIKVTRNRIQTVQSNIYYMKLTNGQKIDEDYALSTRAMPMEKDFIEILKVLSETASLANVTLKDYSFIVGKAPKVGVNLESKSEFVQVEVTFSLEGSAIAMRHLIQQIEKKLPIVELKLADFADNEAQISLVFYSKPLPSVTIEDSVPIEGLTKKENELVSELREW